MGSPLSLGGVDGSCGASRSIALPLGLMPWAWGAIGSHIIHTCIKAYLPF